MTRYVLYQRGPDYINIYPECQGSNPSRGREVASAETLVGLMPAVDRFDHDNWWIFGPGGRIICDTRRDYYSLPSVKREIERIRKEEQA